MPLNGYGPEIMLSVGIIVRVKASKLCTTSAMRDWVVSGRF